jgi:hypothetical protein
MHIFFLPCMLHDLSTIIYSCNKYWLNSKNYEVPFYVGFSIILPFPVSYIQTFLFHFDPSTVLVCSTLRVRDQFASPYQTIRKINFCIVYLSRFLRGEGIITLSELNSFPKFNLHCHL